MKILLLTTLFFHILFSSHAQYISLVAGEKSELSSASASALNWENQKLRSDLTLSEEQFAKIKEITLERYKAREIVVQMFKFEPKKKQAKIKEIESQFDGEFELVLDDKQYKKYLKLNGRVEKKDTEVIAQEPVEPSFNNQIQALISQATKPKIDSSLIPQQATNDSEVALVNDTLMEIVPANIGQTQIEVTNANSLKENSSDSVTVVLDQDKTNTNADSQANSLRVETGTEVMKSKDVGDKLIATEGLEFRTEEKVASTENKATEGVDK